MSRKGALCSYSFSILESLRVALQSSLELPCEMGNGTRWSIKKLHFIIQRSEGIYFRFFLCWSACSLPECTYLWDNDERTGWIDGNCASIHASQLNRVVKWNSRITHGRIWCRFLEDARHSYGFILIMCRRISSRSGLWFRSLSTMLPIRLIRSLSHAYTCVHCEKYNVSNESVGLRRPSKKLRKFWEPQKSSAKAQNSTIREESGGKKGDR